MIYLIMTNLFDYVFIFRYLMILNTTPEKKIFAVMNFIVIQTQNVFNVTIFFEIYNYLNKKMQILIGNSIPLKFIIVVIGCLYYYVISFLIEFVVLSGINALFKLMLSLSKNDNRKAQEQLQKNIEVNGYLETKIENDEVNDLVTQQSMISFIYFIEFQIMLMIMKSVCPQTTYNSYYFSVIHQIRVIYSSIHSRKTTIPI